MMSHTDLMQVKSWWRKGCCIEFHEHVGNYLFFPPDEEMDTTPAPASKAKKAGMVKAKEESEEEEDEDEDDDDDEEEDDDDDEEGMFWCLKMIISS